MNSILQWCSRVCVCTRDKRPLHSVPISISPLHCPWAAMPKDKAGSSSPVSLSTKMLVLLLGHYSPPGTMCKNGEWLWGGMGRLLIVINFVSSGRLLFPFGAALNINFILRAQSESGLDPRISCVAWVGKMLCCRCGASKAPLYIGQWLTLHKLNGEEGDGLEYEARPLET